jgi:hypothetical protein
MTNVEGRQLSLKTISVMVLNEFRLFSELASRVIFYCTIKHGLNDGNKSF